MKYKSLFAFSLLAFVLINPLQAKAISLREAGLKEGDLISSFVYDKDPDIFIVNQSGFKRLFLNPVIFGFYGHLKFAQTKAVKPEIKNQFATSSFYRNCEINDPKVYALEATGEDTATLHHIAIDGNTAVSQDLDFFKKVFCINDREFAWYRKSDEYRSLGEIPHYRRSANISLSIDPAFAEMKVGGVLAVKAIFTPPRPACLDAVNPACGVQEPVPQEVFASFVSDNPGVAAVERINKDCSPPRMCPIAVSRYTLRGVSAGDAVITASYSNNGQIFIAKMNVNVSSPVVPPAFVLATDRQEYFLGETVKGGGSITNPNQTSVSATLRAELYHQSVVGRQVLQWQRDLGTISIPPGITPFPFDAAFGESLVIPQDPDMVGNWTLKLIQTDIQTGTGAPAVVAQTGFKVKSVSPNPILVSFAFAKPSYELDELLDATGNVSNPNSKPVPATLKVELLHNGAMAPGYPKIIPAVGQPDIYIPPGNTPLTVSALLGSDRMPNDPALTGDWKLVVTETRGMSVAQAPFAVTMPKSVTITIDGGSDKGTSRLGNGFLTGFLDGQEFPFPTPEIVKNLKPKFWRVGLAPENYKAVKAFNPKITWETSAGYYALKHTYFPGDPGCQPPNKPCPPADPWNDAQGRPDNFQSYKNYIKSIVIASKQNNMPIDYLDFWSEPNDYGRFGTEAQVFATFKAFHDAVREADPSQKIIGPTLSSFIGGFNQPYDGAGLAHFIDYVADNHLRVDGISWHELDSHSNPEIVPQHVEWARRYLKEKGLCSPACPEIHINEFTNPESHLIPGWTLGWLYYFEKSEVDWASRACWGWEDGRTSDCRTALNGLLLQDNKTPQPLYWVHRFYADMNEGKRLVSESSSQRIIALANKNDSAKEVTILTGRYSCGKAGRWCQFKGTSVSEQKGPPLDTTITIAHYPYATPGSQVKAEIQLIPNEGIPGPLLAPKILPTQTLTIAADGSVMLPIKGFEDGDVYSVVMKAVSSPASTNVSVDVAKQGRDISTLKPGINLKRSYWGSIGGNNFAAPFNTASELRWLLEKYNKDIGIQGRIIRMPEDWYDLLTEDPLAVNEIKRLGGDPLIGFYAIPKELGDGTPDYYRKPPASFDAWRKYVAQVVARYKTLGVSKYEIWNEPDLDEHWLGTQDEFFKLYEATARGIRDADASATIFAPAVFKFDGQIKGSGQLLLNLIDFAASKNLPLDVLSIHDYDKDPDAPHDFDIAPMKARLLQKGYTQTKIAFDEWNWSATERDKIENGNEVSASYVAAQAGQYYAISDVAYQNNYTLIEGNEWPLSSAPAAWTQLGAVTPEGVIKAKYNALRVLSLMGDTTVAADVNGIVTNKVIASKSGDRVTVLLSNYSDKGISDIRLNVQNIPANFTQYTKYIIDAQHSNAYAAHDRIEQKVADGRNKALDAVRSAFTASLKQKGYTDSAIAQEVDMLARWLGNRDDQQFSQWFNSLTDQQRKDFLDATNQGGDIYRSVLTPVIDDINNWSEVKLYSESKTVAPQRSAYGETLSMQPYSVMLIQLSPSL